MMLKEVVKRLNLLRFPFSSRNIRIPVVRLSPKVSKEGENKGKRR